MADSNLPGLHSQPTITLMVGNQFRQQDSMIITPALYPPPHSLHTGGEGQYTQWVHCELIMGSETICPAHTQQVNGGHLQKVPTHLPSLNPVGR